MQFTTIVAAFFFEMGQGRPNLHALVRAAGMTDVAPLEDINRRALGFRESNREVLGGTWGAFGSTWVIFDEVEGLICL